MDEYDFDWSDIYGAGTGGEALGDIVSFLMENLSSQGHFGQDYTGEGEGYYNPFYTGESEIWGPEGIYGEYNLENLMGLIGSEAFQEAQGGWGEGVGALSDLLQSLGLSESAGQFSQDIGDVRSELGGQMRNLRQTMPLKQKGSRYSGLGGASTKGFPGSRKQYMSDFYGLQEKQQEMMGSLQEGFESDFFEDVRNWMADSPAPGF